MSEDDRYLVMELADDEGNAQCLDCRHHGKFLHCDAYGWLAYDGKRWQHENAVAQLDRAVVDTLRARRLAAVQRGYREAIVTATSGTDRHVRGTKSLYTSIVPALVGDFDDDPDLLNCQNGVLNLRTGELVTHDPGQRFTYCIPTNYNPQANQAPWRNFLMSVLKNTTDQELWDYFQDCNGYSITGRTREECFFYLLGPRRGGKGTYTETVLAMLGKPIGTGVDFQTFTAERTHDTQNFDLAPLKPSRFIVASESKQRQRLNAAKIKQMTGGDDIRCAFKRKTHFEYRPQFKIWLASNFPVNADVDDDALWYRLRLIEFPNSFAGREDKALKQALRQPAVLEGVLSWAVEGAIRWYRAGSKGLITPKCVADAGQAAQEEHDYVKQWLAECVNQTNDPEHFVPNTSLYGSYRQWCDGTGVTPKKLGALTRALKTKGYAAGASKWIGTGTKRGCKGVQFSTTQPETDEVKDAT